MTERTGRAPARLGRRLSIFGNPTRTGILIALAILEESYPRELARLLPASLSGVQLAVQKLEREGVVATRRPGSERRVALNPRFFGYERLKDLLWKLSEGQPELLESMRALRRSPRRAGKPL